MKSPFREKREPPKKIGACLRDDEMGEEIWGLGPGVEGLE